MEKGDWKETSAATFWWNLDYLTWRFVDDHQEYDYCISMDFDSCLKLNADNLINDVAERQIDFVGQAHVADMATWYWTKSHLSIYTLEEIEARLLCVVVFSRRAANFLSRRRRQLAKDYEAGLLAFWPFCEIFVGTELSRSGFSMADLSGFGDLTYYTYRPPKYEAELENIKDGSFVHPVYDADRMLTLLRKETPRFSDVFRSKSRLRSEIRKYPTIISVQHLIRESKDRLLRKLARTRSS